MFEFLETFNDKEAEASFSSGDVKTYSAQAIIPYIIPILFFLPIISNKEAQFCRFHANQQLAWLIFCIAFSVISGIIGIIPFIGGLIRSLLSLIWLAIAIVLICGAVTGKAYKLPVIGDLINVF